MLNGTRQLLSRWFASETSDAPVKRKSLNRTLGNLGEYAAARQLQKMGYRILERNYRCPAGEVDIIAEHDGVLAFVEVKTRSPRAFLPPAEAVDSTKQSRIRNSAAYYLAPYRQPSPHRFDIVSVLVDAEDHVTSIEVVKEAFR